MNILHKNLTRASKSNTFRPLILHYLYSLSSKYSTKFPIDDVKEKKSFARPSEIPFQPKVVNRVNFVGTITVPIKFYNSVDGKSWACTFVSHLQQPDFTVSSLRIPIIFEGNLAVTAATHLRENDNVHVAGHLSTNHLPFNLTNEQGKVQVMVHDVYLVRQFHPEVMKHLFFHKKKKKERR